MKSKILFINPPLQPDLRRKNRPIGLVYVMTAVKRAGFDFEYYDMYAHNLNRDDLAKKVERERHDIYALGSVVTAFRLIKDVAAVIRKYRPEALIIAGNSVAASIPELLVRNTEIDVAVIGEGERTTIELLHALQNGDGYQNVRGIAFLMNDRYIKTIPQAAIQNLDAHGFPDWSLLENQLYNEGFFPSHRSGLRPPIAFPILAGRGCPYHCTYCYHVFRGYRFRTYSVSAVVDEIKRLYRYFGASLFFFSDEISFLTRERLAAFVDELERLPFQIGWSPVIRPNLLRRKDISLVRRMRDAGCINVCFGLENANQNILDGMRKKIRIPQVTEQIEALQNGGVIANTSVVFGYPEETLETIRQTYAFCDDFGIVPGVGFLQPFPGTPIYDWARKNGLIRDEVEYLLHAGDREELHVNLTSIPDDDFKAAVISGITDIARKHKIEDQIQFLVINRVRGHAS